MEQRKLCQAKKKNGTLCKRVPIKGKMYCYAHFKEGDVRNIRSIIYNFCLNNKTFLFLVTIIGLIGSLIDVHSCIMSIKTKRETKQAADTTIYNVEKTLINTEIVLDCSAPMRVSFEGRTKFEVAKTVIQKILKEEVAESDNLAFRHFGGPCDGENNWLLVNFNTHNENKVIKTLQDLKPTGNPTLVEALIEATGDFNDVKKFRGVNKKIIAIIGGDDACVIDPEKHILDRLKFRANVDDKIDISFRFIAMGMSTVQQLRVSEIARITGEDSKAVFVKNKSELDSTLSKFLVIESFVVSADTMLSVANNLINYLDEIINDLNEKNYFAAEGKIIQARKNFKNIGLLIDDLGRRKGKEQFKRLYQLAKASREEQRLLIELSETMLVQVKRGKIDDYNKAVTEWNTHSETYNQQIEEINKILREL